MKLVLPLILSSVGHKCCNATNKCLIFLSLLYYMSIVTLLTQKFTSLEFWRSKFHNGCFSPQCISVFLITKSDVCIYIWFSSLIPLINMFIFVPVPCFCYYSSVVQLEVGNRWITSSSSFILQDCFRCPGFFCISTWSWKLAFLDLWWIVLEF